VLDICRLKPINKDLILEYLKPYAKVVTLEEHLLAGGLGSIMAETFIDEGITIPTLRIGQEDRFVFDNGGRDAIWEKYGMDVDSVEIRVCEFATA